MLAKIASDWRKPNGQFAIMPDQVQEFMTGLPVRKIWGIGPKSADASRHAASRLAETCKSSRRTEMVVQFGKWGEELSIVFCRGEDDRAVRPHRISKSLSNENTFVDNLLSLTECEAAIAKLSEELLDELRTKAPERKIRKAFVKVKFSDFTRTTRECRCSEPSPIIYRELLTEAYQRKSHPVRLLGTGVRFEEAAEVLQPELFGRETTGFSY